MLKLRESIPFQSRLLIKPSELAMASRPLPQRCDAVYQVTSHDHLVSDDGLVMTGTGGFFGGPWRFCWNIVNFHDFAKNTIFQC